MLSKYKYVFGLVFIYIIITVIASQKHIIESIYFSKFYSNFSPFIREMMQLIPFSVGDGIYILLVCYLLYKIISIKKYWREDKFKIVNFICITISGFLILFNFLWGFNYYKTPLHEKLKIKKEYSEEQLIKLTELLINRTNNLHLKYAKNVEERIENPDDIQTILDNAASGYHTLSSKNEIFEYKNPTVKPSMFSTLLTYMGFSGYLNPFTNEAQVNDKMPKNNMMVTASHEIAHQIGIGPESEANFVGYLAASKNPNPYFDYAASSFALRYCLRRYPFENEEAFKLYLQKINPGIVSDWQNTREFWEKHETFIDTIFKFLYDKFLKINKQEFGIEGYSMFLDLLIDYELNKKG